MLLGLCKTSDKTCCAVSLWREPCVVSKAAAIAALRGKRAAESPWVSAAPLANAPTEAREGLLWRSWWSKFQGPLSCTVQEERVVAWAGYAAEIPSPCTGAALSQVPYRLVVITDCFGKKALST